MQNRERGSNHVSDISEAVYAWGESSDRGENLERHHHLRWLVMSLALERGLAIIEEEVFFNQ
jgi:hypothetical protein